MSSRSSSIRIQIAMENYKVARNRGNNRLRSTMEPMDDRFIECRDAIHFPLTPPQTPTDRPAAQSAGPRAAGRPPEPVRRGPLSAVSVRPVARPHPAPPPAAAPAPTPSAIKPSDVRPPPGPPAPYQSSRRWPRRSGDAPHPRSCPAAWPRRHWSPDLLPSPGPGSRAPL